MPEETKRHSSDSTLGMNQDISRRDFMNATLLASGGALLGGLTPYQALAQIGKDNWTGYGGIGDYAQSNGNTYEVMSSGHQIRDNVFANPPPAAVDTGEVLDLVVVGGGLSGLYAAHYCRQKAPHAKCLVLDNHPIFGGEGKQNEFRVDGRRLVACQGSVFFSTPQPGTRVAELYASIGVPAPKFEYQSWEGPSPEVPVGTCFEDIRAPYGLYFGGSFGANPGVWVIDPWTKQLEGAPIPASMRSELLKYRTTLLAEREQARGGGPAARPSRPHELDAITMEQYMMQTFGLSQETIRKCLTPGPGDSLGLGPDVMSAYAFEGSNAAGFPAGEGGNKQSFPGGNGGFARHIVKMLVPAAISGPATLEGVANGQVNFNELDKPGQSTRIRLSCTVVRVEHERPAEKSDFVRVTYTQGGKIYSLKARGVVMAGGCWTTKHIVIDLPSEQRAAYEQMHRSPSMVVSVALHNWRFLYKLGIAGGFWPGGSLGEFGSIRKVPTFSTKDKTMGPDFPAVMGIKVLFCKPGLSMTDQQAIGRAELLSTPYVDYERRVREQLTEMFGRSGFDARRDIAGIILNRWGHAYCSPQPGSFFGKDGQPAPREVLRQKPFGRIAFANTDLVGATHTGAMFEGQRAITQLLDRI
jgi:spermidine dehydrogenase